MVLQVVFLELLVPQWEVLVVEEVMGQVVADVAEDAATVGSHRSMPVPEDQAVGELPERSSKDDEESGRHDQAILVHGQVVMNAMEEEVQRDAHSVIGKIAVQSVSNTFVAKDIS